MIPGPIPTGNARRRNKPTIPTTVLPAEGFAGPYPRPPRWVHLGAEGAAWWRWAWRTPQAAGWSAGNLVAIARRAQLEDDLAALRDIEGIDVDAVLDELSAGGLVAAMNATAKLRWLVQALAALVTGKLALYREARELDDRIGLTPKGMAALRWTIRATEEEKPAAATPPSARRLKAVDSTAS